MPYRFGPFTADRARYRVTRGDAAVDLTPKLLDLLFHLLERPGLLVTKEELLDAVWPGANVTDNALAQAVSELREALGDEAASPTYIRTVARRGYRFVAPVETDSSPAGPRPRAATAAAADDARAVAVADFDNLSGDADLAWLATGIAETVTNDLAALGRFRVIDRWRVVQAARQNGGSMTELGRAVGAGLVVTGSYQRSGGRLRITARLVDLDRGDVLADAKVDGRIDDVFDLQDEVVSCFARELGVPRGRAAAALGVRETSSLDAYRAYTEGLVRIESLDTSLAADAAADFRRAIACDPAYAAAYAGLANAEFVAYEMTRTGPAPDTAALASGIEHARRAIQLDEELAEAHATLSFLLVSALEFDEARDAAERAVSLEPDNWRHLYRLGHALWGNARLRALERAAALYPQFAYAAFEAAMVQVARGRLDEAERIARRRVEAQDRRPGAASRFPEVGFHWLLGAIEAAAGRHDAAIAQFDLEIAQADARRLYSPEYAAAALVDRGHVLLARGATEAALDSFRGASVQVAGDWRAGAGEALTLERLGRRHDAATAWKQLEARLPAPATDPPGARWLLSSACLRAARGDAEGAVAGLNTLLDTTPSCHLGWHLPLEPLLLRLSTHDGLAAVLRRLAARAN